MAKIKRVRDSRLSAGEEGILDQAIMILSKSSKPNSYENNGKTLVLVTRQ